jgi:hypothetical protein
MRQALALKEYPGNMRKRIPSQFIPARVAIKELFANKRLYRYAGWVWCAEPAGQGFKGETHV